jgi:Histidine kinase-, DNA gyrase B-, and HSP90-like ATPase
MGETRVDLLHLLQDLADAYPGDLHETILTEVIANALDSGASRVRLETDLSAQALTVVDDGRGMRRADLRRFHDLGASTKTRGQGIGFAGVGIKLGLLVSDEVITESRLAVALALGKVAVDPTREREFVLEFLARWGEAREGVRRRKGRRGEPRR